MDAPSESGPEGTNVWVGALPPGVDEETFNSLFSPYGTITSARVYTERCYGFVAFTTVEEAKTVVETLNGADCGGKTIQVRFADNNSKRGTTTSNVPTAMAKGNYGPWKGGGGDWKGGGGCVRSGYGGGVYNRPGSGAVGWGCGMKEDPMMAIGTAPSYAYKPGAGKAGGGNKGFGGSICDSQDKVLVNKSSWAWTRGREDCNVFIRNLPEEADELWLYKLCAPMGSILSTFAKTSEKGRIGFVTYGSESEAQFAIENLTGMMARNSDQPLHLSVQYKKDKAMKGGKGQHFGKGKSKGGETVPGVGAFGQAEALGDPWSGAGGGCGHGDGDAGAFDAAGGFEAALSDFSAPEDGAGDMYADAAWG